MTEQNPGPAGGDPADASQNLETEVGEENADMLGAEEEGPTKAPDADGGAYVIP